MGFSLTRFSTPDFLILRKNLIFAGRMLKDIKGYGREQKHGINATND